MADEFKLLRKVLIKRHNFNVAERYSHVLPSEGIGTPDGAMRHACIIRSRDTAQVMLLKLELFYLVMSNLSTVAGIPESFDVKVGSNRPQLIVVYRPLHKHDNKWGNSQICIPHFMHVPHAKPHLPTYHRGNHYGIYVMPDNSRIHINAISRAEAERVITALLKHVPPQFHGHQLVGHNNPKFGETTGHKEIEVRPYRASWFPHGRDWKKKKGYPDDVFFY